VREEVKVLGREGETGEEFGGEENYKRDRLCSV
jgi:hypothetical protein